jgi:hypothetical protein
MQLNEIAAGRQKCAGKTAINVRCRSFIAVTDAKNSE